MIYLLYPAYHVPILLHLGPLVTKLDIDLISTPGPPLLVNVTGHDSPESGYEASNLNTNSN